MRTDFMTMKMTGAHAGAAFYMSTLCPSHNTLTKQPGLKVNIGLGDQLPGVKLELCCCGAAKPSLP